MMYRDATATVAAEAVALWNTRRAELDALPAEVVGLYARRRARIAFGVGAAFGWVAMASTMLSDVDGATWMLLCSWALAVGAAGVAFAVATVVGRARLRRAIAFAGDPYQRLAGLRGVDVGDAARDLALPLRHASQAWPLIAANLLLPHTLHLLFWLVWTHGDARIGEFDEWIAFTTVFSPHVFAYSVYAAWRFPRTRRVGRPILIASALALVPSVVLLGVSAVITFVTASAVALLAYLPMDAVIDRDDVAELAVRNA